MDPLVGLIGAFVIAAWSLSLIRSSGSVLLDMMPQSKVADAIRERLEVRGDKISDLHLWRLGPGHTGVIVSVVADHPQPVEAYKAKLEGLQVSRTSPWRFMRVPAMITGQRELGT